MEDLAFGKYGWFVWPSIILFVVVIGGLIAQTLIAAAAVRRRLKRLEARAETRRTP